MAITNISGVMNKHRKSGTTESAKSYEGKSKGPIPKRSRHLARITSIEARETAKGGMGIPVKFEIIDGDYEKWKLSDWINIDHPTNEDCVERGLKDFLGLCKACGFDDYVEDLNELYRKVVSIEIVKHEVDKDDPDKVWERPGNYMPPQSQKGKDNFEDSLDDDDIPF